MTTAWDEQNLTNSSRCKAPGSPLATIARARIEHGQPLSSTYELTIGDRQVAELRESWRIVYGNCAKISSELPGAGARPNNRLQWMRGLACF